jgi:uncharacterized Ntn-hydrolase superfamily protein
MKHTLLSALLLFFLSQPSIAQHTFSIVAIDSITGEIGSAGATCGDSIIWPGTPGAYLISDVLPGIGAIHSQSFYLEQNQINARNRMLAGDSPEEIIDWLETNDVQNQPGRRQYGVIDFNNGSPRAAGYTGISSFDYKDHLIGPNYAIQGNILIGPEVLDSMEARFNREEGCLADKLMAAMQGANIIGADSRCIPEEVSSLSAFIRMARPDDATDDLYLDINVAGTADGVEPIDVLQERYDQWKSSFNCTVSSVDNPENLNSSIKVYPNPVSDIIYLESKTTLTSIRLHDAMGKLIINKKDDLQNGRITISTEDIQNGIYFISMYNEKQLLAYRKITIQKN